MEIIIKPKILNENIFNSLSIKWYNGGSEKTIILVLQLLRLSKLLIPEEREYLYQRGAHIPNLEISYIADV